MLCCLCFVKIVLLFSRTKEPSKNLWQVTGGVVWIVLLLGTEKWVRPPEHVRLTDAHIWELEKETRLLFPTTVTLTRPNKLKRIVFSEIDISDSGASSGKEKAIWRWVKTKIFV